MRTNRTNRANRAILAGVAAATAAPATAQFIGFDEFTGPVTDQYAELALFSSDPGAHCVAVPFGTTHSPPNALSSALDTGEITGAENLYIDFANPITGLSFWAIDASVPGVTARFVVWDFHTVSVTDFVSTGDPLQRIDLTTYPVITRLEIIDITRDPAEAGIAWDSFEFIIVPAPGPAPLVLACVAARRRRRAGPNCPPEGGSAWPLARSRGKPRSCSLRLTRVA
ncbi:MAG: hypothetical protein IT431_17105 [Phycisphaerales bacterium]|nr:hypothetical protein [Phycisphaerales bacterium]